MSFINYILYACTISPSPEIQQLFNSTQYYVTLGQEATITGFSGNCMKLQCRILAMETALYCAYSG